MKLTKTGRSRLMKLIEALDALPREAFNFETVVDKFDRAHSCATVACAIGWTPRIFPRLAQWTRTEYGFDSVTPRGGASTGIIRDDMDVVAKSLFGLTSDHCEIFVPNGQKSVHVNLPDCGFDATPKQVAKMLRKFITLADAGKIN